MSQSPLTSTIRWIETQLSVPRAGIGGHFLSLGLLSLISAWTAVATETYWLMGLPLLVIGAFWAAVDFKALFFALFAFIPISTEVFLPNGFATDLPTEPLIVGLMFVTVLYLLRNSTLIDGRFFRHPLSILIFLHWGWIGVCSFLSDEPFISFKYFLAKTWYLATFYILAGLILRSENRLRLWFWCVTIPLIFSVLVTLFRHGYSYGFTFDTINKVTWPFYRNHVNYAATLSVFFPILWLARGWYTRLNKRYWLLTGMALVLLAGINFAYTRAAYVALAGALGAWWIIRKQWIKPALFLALAFAISLSTWLVYKNKYLEYAPNYERTVTHYRFDNLLEATYKMEDISTMERFYRWVAGGYMAVEHPWMGFGPGNFPTFYRTYTVTSFQTYVSDNPENSGIHSYYLMTLVEQGFPGLMIFLLLTCFPFLMAERLYHRHWNHSGYRRLILMMALCLVVIHAFLTINDLVETDKLGSFFFTCMAVLVNIDTGRLQLKQEEAH